MRLLRTVGTANEADCERLELQTPLQSFCATLHLNNVLVFALKVRILNGNYRTQNLSKNFGG